MRAVGAHAGDGLARAVDRVRGTGEPAGEDVAEQLAADRAASRRGADHGHGFRLEERLQRRRHGDVVALVDARLVALRRLDREPHLDDAAVERARGPEADVLEHGEHGLVLGQDLRDERLDAVRGGALGKLLEEAGADALALEVVGDGERCLRRVRVAEADVVADRDDPFVARLAHDADQRPLLGPVGLDEGACEPVAGEGETVKAEEAAADGELGEERHERRARRSSTERAGGASSRPAR